MRWTVVGWRRQGGWKVFWSKAIWKVNGHGSRLFQTPKNANWSLERSVLLTIVTYDKFNYTIRKSTFFFIFPNIFMTIDESLNRTFYHLLWFRSTEGLFQHFPFTFQRLWTKKLFTPPAASTPPQFTSYHSPAPSSHLSTPIDSHTLSLTYIYSTYSLFHRPRAFQTSPALFCRFLLLFSFPQKQVSLHLYSVAGISFFDWKYLPREFSTKSATEYYYGSRRLECFVLIFTFSGITVVCCLGECFQYFGVLSTF